jgi:hypothetical protein
MLVSILNVQNSCLEKSAGALEGGEVVQRVHVEEIPERQYFTTTVMKACPCFKT